MNRNSKHLIFLLFAIFILRAPGLYQPILDIDETVFSEFANIIIDGGIPYVEAVDNKPPLMYYFFSSIYLIFGKNNLIAVHFITTIIVMLTAILIYFFGKEIKNERCGLISAIVFTALAHIYEPKYISSNGETIINLPLIISSLLFIKYNKLNKKEWSFYLVSGFCLGTAVITNYKAGILSLVFLIHAIIFRGIFSGTAPIYSSIIRESNRLLIIGFASIIPIVIIILYFLNLGNIEESIFWGFTYNLKYISTGSEAVPLIKTIGRFAYFIVCSLPVWIISIIFIINKFSSSDVLSFSNEEKLKDEIFIFLLLWTGFSFYSATLGGRAYGHYFIQIIVPLSILCGYAYIHIIHNLKKVKIIFWSFLLIINLLFFLSRIDINYTYSLINYPNWEADITYQKIGKYIKENSDPKDKIFAWGWSTPIYYYSNRRCSSRFLIADYISGRIFGINNDSQKIKKNSNRKIITDLLKDFNNSPPLYFIDTTRSNLYGYSRFPIKNYDELHRIIDKNYTLTKIIDKVDVYKRRF
ncbi:MAG: glycosyltransferase family 39 protein [Spirochaetota bacterium]|nr:glycosyltransferase family 39 protein [Spirochaetota bacterium]